MLLGYTINGAIQLGIEDKKGSITAGKDADFLVFENISSRRSMKDSPITCRAACISA